MSDYVKVGNLQVAKVLYDFVNNEALPETGLDQDKFWSDFGQLVADLTPKNKALLEKREELQKKIDEWHKENKPFDFEKYKAFLKEIGYLEPEVEDFEISTEGLDDEIREIAGPQLVVPINNARYALNAANARWGSLYDALYGTDAISEEGGAEKKGEYNPVRGNKVIEYSRNFLDDHIPLASGSHKEVVKYAVADGKFAAELENGETVGLKDESQFVGYQGEPDNPSAVLVKNNGLHVEIQIDRSHPIGKDDKAGVKDLVIESAISTIIDCEDSVTAVDANDKVEVYKNWLGLIKGTDRKSVV